MIYVIDGVLRAISITSEESMYDVVIVPDGPRDVADFYCRLPRDEARDLIGLVGKKVRVTLTPKIEAR